MGDKKPTPSKPVPDRRIEEIAFDLPGLRSNRVPQLYTDFVERIAPRLNLGATGWRLLSAFENLDVTADKIGSIIHANPYLEGQLLRVVDSYGRKEPVEKIEAAVILFGVQSSRNLVLALQLLRRVRGLHLAWKKDGKLETQPKDLLRFALKSEESLADAQGGGSDMAFAAGLLFDTLALCADTLVEEKTDKRKVLSWIDTVYSHGLASARLASEIAVRVPGFGYKKYAFSGAMIHDAGKIAMAILDRRYLSFWDACTKAGMPRALRHFAEREMFGIDHAILGALICRYFRSFRAIELSIRHHHDPFLIRSESKNLFELAALISVSSNVASQMRRVDKLDDPIFAVWRGPEASAFGVTPAVIQAAIKAVQG